MAAIITEQYRKNSASLLYNDVKDNRYFIGLGKSDNWFEELSLGQVAPFPRGTVADDDNLKNALSDLITVNNNNIARAIPNVEIVNGLVYKQYNTYDSGCFYPSDGKRPCYVINSAGEIFICLKSPGTAINFGNVQFSGKNVFEFSAGYIWAYAGLTLINSKVGSNKFVALSLAADPNPVPESAGAVFGFSVLNGGSGYAAGTNIELYGILASDGTVEKSPDNAIASVDASGKIISVSTALLFGANTADKITFLRKNYSYAYAKVVSIGGGSGAVIAPMLTPSAGLGADSTKCTPSWYVGIQGEGSSTIGSINSQYSQISLCKYTGDLSLNGGNISLLNNISLTPAATLPETAPLVIVRGAKITQGINDIGVVHSFNATTKTIYYNNGIGSGFVDPLTTSDIIITNAGQPPLTIIAADLDSADKPALNKEELQVTFVDNRTPINVTENQTEDLKIIIQL
jgi:hypothetical protein